MQPSFSTHPVELLRQLIRFDTSNPPGQEKECINYLRAVLQEAGLTTTILARDPERPNLLARLRGRGDAPPLLLQGHVDVVPATEVNWSYPPFSGTLINGEVWGRGAADMKGGVAMMVAACLQAAHDAQELPGDIVLALVADEEAGGDYGARYLVEEHAQYFKDIRHSLGESGGVAFYLGGKKFVPIQVLEKQVCWLRLTIQGQAGHASVPCRDGVIAHLWPILQRLVQTRLPLHMTAITRGMFETFAAQLADPLHTLFTRVLDPEQTERIIEQMGTLGEMYDAMLRHTINVTTLQVGETINVLPHTAILQLDCRLLPGYDVSDLLAELRPLIGAETACEIIRYDRGCNDATMDFFPILAHALQQVDAACIPIPMLQVATTDARFFARLGIRNYGFLPMDMAPDYGYLQGVHGINERVPVAAIEFGTRVLGNVLRHPARCGSAL